MSGAVAMRDELAELHPELLAAYGFVPKLFRGQSDLPRAIKAEGSLLDAVLVHENRLKRHQKEGLLRAVANVWKNDYCLRLFGKARAGASETDSALLKFTFKLAEHGPWFSGNDVEVLRIAGFDEMAILEAVATTAVGQLLCTLAAALHPALDPELTSPVAAQLRKNTESHEWIETPGPYLQSQPKLADDFPPYIVVRDQFGFVPNLFQIQSLWPELVEAEIRALELILFPEDHLSRTQKENILLVVSAANLNTYCVAVHSQILNTLGVPLEDSDQIVEDHNSGSIFEPDKALLNEVRKLARSPAPSEVRFDPEHLRAHGFTGPQIVEGVVMAALTNFLNTLQFGLGAVPDFPPRRVFNQKDLHRLSAKARPTSDDATPADPDAELVARVQGGEVDGFEELVRRHTRRIFATLAGMLGNTDDARDATQDVFLKAFEHIGRFQGRSKFSTWLTSIAINTGTEMLRQRKPSESLQDEDDDESFRPRQVQSWADSPEQLLATSQTNDLVRQGILRLPQKYRVAVLLRDINQLSTEEAAVALSLSIPALKARLLRGRLMLRESLAPYFISAEKRTPDA